MASEIKSVGVVGTGIIGASWTALFLAHGLQVLVSDPAPNAEKALAEHLERFWPTLEEIGLKPGASLGNYRFVGATLGKYYGEVDYIQENAPEKPELKSKVIAEIDAGTRPETVIASSSSGIPSSQFIAQCKHHPERILIGHPFNPPHLMPLVEVVPHPGTSSQAIATALQFYKSMGRAPIHVKKEMPGHVANRLQAALVNEAYSLVSHGIVSATDLDACVTSSVGPRWALVGPFMSSISGGGGGKGGFEHFLAHLGPAMQGWLKDMKAQQIDYDEATLGSIAESVAQEQDHFDITEVEKQRDQLLVRIIKEKKAAPALV